MIDWPTAVMLLPVGPSIAAVWIVLARHHNQRRERAEARKASARPIQCHHIWDKWGEPTREGVYEKGRIIPFKYECHQRRNCTICNEIEHRQWDE